ncbi:XAC0095 family protein [Pseudomonas sp. CGJS7]|uniref:XAC0095 family protein n=1 Tax=Pseudomonas sp. CGJS7 TaxID=3109348 RepID=UPI00300B68A1
MPRKTSPTPLTRTVVVPLDTFLALQAFHDELIGIAGTIDPATAPAPAFAQRDQSRRSALAQVFWLWAEQMDRNLKTMRPA